MCFHTLWKNKKRIKVYAAGYGGALKVIGSVLKRISNFEDPRKRFQCTSLTDEDSQKVNRPSKCNWITRKGLGLLGTMSSSFGSVFEYFSKTILWTELKCAAKISRISGHALEKTADKAMQRWTNSRSTKVLALPIKYTGKGINMVGKGLDHLSNRIFS